MLMVSKSCHVQTAQTMPWNMENIEHCDGVSFEQVIFVKKSSVLVPVVVSDLSIK